MKIRITISLLLLCLMCLTSVSCNTSNNNKKSEENTEESVKLTTPVTTTEETTITRLEITQPVTSDSYTMESDHATNSTEADGAEPEPERYYLVDPEKEYPRYVVDEVLLETDWHGSTATLFKGRYISEKFSYWTGEPVKIPGEYNVDNIGGVLYNNEVVVSEQFSYGFYRKKDPSYAVLEGNVIYIKTDVEDINTIDLYFAEKGEDGNYKIAYENIDELSHNEGSKYYLEKIDLEGNYKYKIFDTDGNWRSLPWMTESVDPDDSTKTVKSIDKELDINTYVTDQKIFDNVFRNYIYDNVTLYDYLYDLKDCVQVDILHLMEGESNASIHFVKTFELKDTYVVDSSYY